MPPIPCEFSEAQFQAFIESCFIEDFRNNNQFDIYYYSGSQERSLGYDMEVKTYIPIFLQMKVGDFYLNGSTNTDMLARRNNFNYSDSPGAYYFYLHVDSKTKDYLQHNLLVALCNNSKYARYIAPLFISQSLLMSLKYNIPSIHWKNIYQSFLKDSTNLHAWRDYLNFPHSILIKPHGSQTKVANVHHKYFFNRSKQISFHSEPVKVENAEYFSEFISVLSKDILERNSSYLSIENIFSNIVKAITENFSNKTDSLADEMSFIEDNITHERIESLSEMKYSFRNFSILTQYVDKRFGIKTLLAGEKNYGSYFMGYL